MGIARLAHFRAPSLESPCKLRAWCTNAQSPLPDCQSFQEVARAVSPKVQGTLDGQDHADTYTLWRKPGQYRYELEVSGAGALNLRLEACRTTGDGKSGAASGWQVIEERLSIPCGSNVTGAVSVPEVPIDALLKVEWVQLRLRISRAVPTKAVGYEFTIDPGNPEPGFQPTDQPR